MKNDKIIIKNANENNLKSIDIEIPKNKLVTITGVSGSGKSSLAFDVLYSEGRRRYVESLSAYARQFLGNASKPDVESIEGLTPAIAVDQKSTNNNPRSTVGTITEVYDLLRILFARVGKPYCPNHNIRIESQTITQIVNQIFKNFEGRDILILSQVENEKKGTHKDLLKKLSDDGFIRVKINDKIQRLDRDIKLDKNKKHTISIVVDRNKVIKDNKSRIFEAIEVSSQYTNGNVIVEDVKTGEKQLYSRNLACKHGDFQIGEIEPRTFSFNSHIGSCKECNGLGKIRRATWDTLIDEEKSIFEGGILYFGDKFTSVDFQRFEAILKEYKIDPNKKLKSLTKKQKDVIVNGSDKELFVSLKTSGGLSYEANEFVEGVAQLIERRHEATSSKWRRDWYEKFLTDSICDVCEGKRLNQEALSVKIMKKDIFDVTDLSIDDSIDWISNLKLTQTEKEISSMVCEEIKSRLQFLQNLGLGYLNMSRPASSLSGGEAQRIRLASQLGSKLSGIIYVLDEPSIGLHQSDNSKLIDSLKQMRDLGNTIIVVEHDEEMMIESDYIIDIGPEAGNRGGQIIFSGTPEQLIKSKTPTANFISGRETVLIPNKIRKGNGKTISVKGAIENNLKNINAEIPLGKFVAITGISGSGKSTLLNDVFYKNFSKKIGQAYKGIAGKVESIKGEENIDKIVRVSQSPIGKTSRSNPATYTGVFDDIREIFSETEAAKIKGYKKGRFSFNVAGGRCEKCNGDGHIKVSMNFMPDIEVTCDECNGKRYNEETLQIKYKDKNIHDILSMEVTEAYELFKSIPKIKDKLQLLIDVGMGYITLGHPSTLLSGGEAQRIKIATFLQKKPTGKTIYILDEPTTGLHNSDIIKLMAILNRIVSNGDTVVVIEHNLDVIKAVDHVIDMGPHGGESGGKIVAKGTPREVSNNLKSVTGKFLKPYFKK